MIKIHSMEDFENLFEGFLDIVTVEKGFLEDLYDSFKEYKSSSVVELDFHDVCKIVTLVTQMTKNNSDTKLEV